ncbi:MAG TPA: DUF5672 family protein [Longimicrobiales bacterium]
MAEPRKLVAVVVPASDRTELTADEEISLRHLLHFLGDYDRYLVLPRGSDLRLPGFAAKRFNRKFFGSARAHTRLMLSRRFYAEFREYRYILIYHLDALVFSDQLREWCETGLDYIGAPWLRSAEEPAHGFAGVGNGGFSLRKVSSMLRVLDSRRYQLDPEAYWARYHAWKPWPKRLFGWPLKGLKRAHRLNGARWEASRFRGNEDKFWAKRAQHYDPEFRIAPVEVALRFAFEVAPRYCFEQNQRTLPFGCHAWPRYDRAFWEPYLLK